MSAHAAARCIAPWLLALAVCACRAPVHRVGFVVRPDKEAVVLVLGDELQIEVVNDGPGAVWLSFDAPGDELDEEMPLERKRVGRTLHGPVRLVCRSLDGHTARLQVRARGAEGMALDQ